MLLADWFGSSSVSTTTPSSPFSQRIAVGSVMVFLVLLAFRALSEPLDDGGDAHADADAERGEAVAERAPLDLVDQRAQDHAAGGAEGMAHGDGAAVHVHRGGVDLHVLHEAHRYRGEGLVDLPEVDLLLLHAGAGERL